MADNVTTQTSTLATIPTSTKISTDEDVTNGHVQRVKLAYSADGSSTHVAADADGMLVNLGANNDVTVTSGTVDLGATDNAVLDQLEVNTSYGDNVGNGTASGSLRVTVASDTTGVLSIDDNGGSLTVDGTVTADLGATDNAVLDQIETNTSYGDNTGGGVEAGSLRVTIANDSTGVVSIDDNGGAITVDNGGTFAVQSASAGDVAHDSADSGNPVKVGGKAVNIDGTAPGTAVTENDRANILTDVYGRQLVQITHPNYWHTSADYASAQTNATVKAAPGAGLKLFLTDITISNGATAGNITLLDGSGGTVLLEIYPAINGGMSHSYRTPIALTANTLLAITSTTVTTHSVTVGGFIAP